MTSCLHVAGGVSRSLARVAEAKGSRLFGNAGWGLERAAGDYCEDWEPGVDREWDRAAVGWGVDSVRNGLGSGLGSGLGQE